VLVQYDMKKGIQRVRLGKDCFSDQVNGDHKRWFRAGKLFDEKQRVGETSKKYPKSRVNAPKRSFPEV